MSSEPVKRKPNRRRTSSVTVTDALKQIPLNQAHQEPHAHAHHKSPSPIAESGSTTKGSEVKPLSGPSRPRSKKSKDDLPEWYRSNGFWNDLKTGRWMLIPSSSFKLMVIPIILWKARRELPQELVGSRLPCELCSLLVILMTLNILRPLAKRLGIKGAKIERFTEQGYAVFYMGILGSCGIWVMHGLPIWWYKTEEFWVGYPYMDMTPQLKAYYLLQAAYWIQQTIILAAKIEKPRKDFRELVIHHLVTLWLIGWSFSVYHTYLGVAVFVSMDVSDTFLALAKCVNYVNESWSAPVFAFFVGVWTYFRHYLNLWLLWSIWTQFELMPAKHRIGFDPLNDQWMTWWMRYQIFGPIFILQLINLYWYFLIWRILIRAVFGSNLKDERSDDEDEDGDGNEGEQTTTEKVKGGHAE